jgi:hypothetical protein
MENSLKPTSELFQLILKTLHRDMWGKNFDLFYLFHRNGFSKVAGLVNITATQHGYVV